LPDKAHEIIGEVCHADLGPGAVDADGANEELHLSLLSGKDVLDR
jgi:hypothetical protein